MTQFLEGQFGPYVIDRVISEAGQGVVYLATKRALGNQVVIKLLRDHLAQSDSFISRFREEALTMAQVQHPNIARVQHSGRETGRYLIEMEFIEGADLSRWLKEGTPPVAVALEILIHVCHALEHSHSKNIIHRDIKPANVMLTTEGQVKVLDFGLARDLDESTRLTVDGTMMGTYHYMSPQQARGEDATFSFDVYSLGALAYELACGRVPFPGTNPASVLHRIQSEEPEPLQRLQADVPAALARLVHRMLEKQEARRPRTIHEVRQELEKIATRVEGSRMPDLLFRFVQDPHGIRNELKARSGAGRPRLPRWLGGGAGLLATAAALASHRPPMA